MASYKENPSEVLAIQKATLKKVVKKPSESSTSALSSSPNSPKTIPKKLNQESEVLANQKATLKKVVVKKAETSTISYPNSLKPMPKNQQADFANAKNRLKKVCIV